MFNVADGGNNLPFIGAPAGPQAQDLLAYRAILRHPKLCPYLVCLDWNKLAAETARLAIARYCGLATDPPAGPSRHGVFLHLVKHKLLAEGPITGEPTEVSSLSVVSSLYSKKAQVLVDFDEGVILQALQCGYTAYQVRVPHLRASQVLLEGNFARRFPVSPVESFTEEDAQAAADFPAASKKILKDLATGLLKRKVEICWGGRSDELRKRIALPLEESASSTSSSSSS